MCTLPFQAAYRQPEKQSGENKSKKNTAVEATFEIKWWFQAAVDDVCPTQIATSPGLKTCGRNWWWKVGLWHYSNKKVYLKRIINDTNSLNY